MHDHDELTRLAENWERIGREHGVRQFTGNDHLLFANELRTVLAQGAKTGGVELDYVPGLLDRTCPPKIWLQIDTTGDNEDRTEAMPESAWGDLSWCYESIGGQEVVYIRADLVAPEPAAQHEGSAVDDAMVERAARKVAEIAGEDFDALDDFTRGVLIDTQRQAFDAALTPPKTQEPQ